MSVSDRSVTRLQISPSASKLKGASRIGVALGPGLPIGLVDLGMLIALKQLKVPISMISGTSMGAVMGALVASGADPLKIRKEVGELFAKDKIARLIKGDRKFPFFGPSTADSVIAEIVKFAGWDPEFHELMIPLYVVTSDKKSQKPVIIRHGKVFDAVRASMARPVLIAQQQMGDMQLADGAVFSPLNTEVLYSEGADYVFGIQAKPIRSETNREMPLINKMEPYLLKVLGWKSSPDIILSKPGCDILLRPRVPQELAKDGSRVDEIIELGVKITYEAMGELSNMETEMEKSAIRTQQRIQTTAPASPDINIDKEFGDLESYIRELAQSAEGMSDAELMDVFPEFTKAFRVFMDRLASEYPDPAEMGKVLKTKLQELSGSINDSPFFKRCLDKPLGYAGDFQMMIYIYEEAVFEAQSNMAKLLNYYIFDHPAANAVRNRAKIIQGMIQQRMAQLGSLSIASIACGPAREVAATVQMLGDSMGKIKWTLFDQDKEAMEAAKSRLPDDPRLEATQINAGVKELIRKTVSIGNQDIIYSLGLFDYLEDKVASTVIQRLYDELNPGGLLVVGNFADHPLRGLMEAAMDWYLLYRTVDDCLRIGKNGAPDGEHFVMQEPEGVNLILVISKPLKPYA